MEKRGSHSEIGRKLELSKSASMGNLGPIQKWCLVMGGKVRWQDCKRMTARALKVAGPQVCQDFIAFKSGTEVKYPWASLQ